VAGEVFGLGRDDLRARAHFDRSSCTEVEPCPFALPGQEDRCAHHRTDQQLPTMSRHSKNNTARGHFTYAERQMLEYGTKKVLQQTVLAYSCTGGCCCAMKFARLVRPNLYVAA